jgi:dihydrofolate reductase
MHGDEGGSTGVDNERAQRGMENVGAWILGRNMFGPARGPWPDESWKGWWGEEPPYHVPTFVLTHHPRDSVEMKGGTTFHFVTDGIHAALQQAKAAAKDKDVRIGGGVAQFSSTFAQGSSTNCISRFVPSSWARARIYSQASTWQSSDIVAPNMSPRSLRCICSLRETRKPRPGIP